MSELLVYQTSDPGFADKAIDAMEAAGIPCFQTGHGWVDLQLTRQYLGEGICIYIRDERDAPRANQILIDLVRCCGKAGQIPTATRPGACHSFDHCSGHLCGYALGIEPNSQIWDICGETVPFAPWAQWESMALASCSGF